MRLDEIKVLDVFNRFSFKGSLLLLIDNSYIKCENDEYESYIIGNNRIYNRYNDLIFVKYDIEQKGSFFKDSFSMIRLYKNFIDTEEPFYKSLFSSIKSHILKKHLENGGLIEIVETQKEMKIGIIKEFKIPKHRTLEEHKEFSNSLINLIQNES